MKTKTTKRYYSNNNKSYTGNRYARNCPGRSVWNLVLTETGKIYETVEETNYTGKMNHNIKDIQFWLLKNRGY